MRVQGSQEGVWALSSGKSRRGASFGKSKRGACKHQGQGNRRGGCKPTPDAFGFRFRVQANIGFGSEARERPDRGSKLESGKQRELVGQHRCDNWEIKEGGASANAVFGDVKRG